MFFAGNNIFYKNLNDKELDIFGPTIRTWWNAQNEKFKDDLMNHIVSLFDDNFNKKRSHRSSWLKFEICQGRL